MTDEEIYAAMGLTVASAPASVDVDSSASAVEEVPGGDTAESTLVSVPTPENVAAIAGDASSRWSYDTGLGD